MWNRGRELFRFIRLATSFLFRGGSGPACSGAAFVSLTKAGRAYLDLLVACWALTRAIELVGCFAEFYYLFLVHRRHVVGFFVSMCKIFLFGVPWECSQLRMALFELGSARKSPGRESQMSVE